MYKIKTFVNSKGDRRYGVCRNGRLLFVCRSLRQAEEQRRLYISMGIRFRLRL